MIMMAVCSNLLSMRFSTSAALDSLYRGRYDGNRGNEG
jgi:hypothetical protein